LVKKKLNTWLITKPQWNKKIQIKTYLYVVFVPMTAKFVAFTGTNMYTNTIKPKRELTFGFESFAQVF
jgi:hypothetical protein